MNEAETEKCLISVIPNHSKQSSFLSSFSLYEVSMVQLFSKFKENEEKVSIIWKKLLKGNNQIDLILKEIGDVFIFEQKNRVYNDAVNDFIHIIQENLNQIIRKENDIRIKYDWFTHENENCLVQVNAEKNEINLSKNLYFDEKEEFKAICEDMNEISQSIVLHHDKWSKYQIKMSNLLKKIGNKNQEIRDYMKHQSSLRTKEINLNSQIQNIKTDCEALSIDIKTANENIQCKQNQCLKLQHQISEIKKNIEYVKEIIITLENKIVETKKSFEATNENNLKLKEIIEAQNLKTNELCEANSSTQNDVRFNLKNNIKGELKKENEWLHQRENQIEILIKKNDDMIRSYNGSLAKKKENYERLHSIFKLRKLMFQTVLKDYDHKIDKELQKMNKINMQLSREPKLIRKTKITTPINRSKFLSMTPQLKSNSKLFPSVISLANSQQNF